MAFCGPIGETGRPAGGGYEAANRRNCDALARRGVKVIELPYPKVAGSSLKKLLSYTLCFLRNGLFLVAHRDQYDVFHLTPLNRYFAFAETLLASCARLVGKPVLIDIRAGTFLRLYQDGSTLYRRTIDRTLRQASQVSVEGQEYVAFVRLRTRRPVFYFPNYVDSPSLRRPLPPRRIAAGDTVRLLYFGRLVPEKGVETTLKAVVDLAKRGHDVHLEFIGEGPAAFVAEMRERYAHLPVTWTASLPVDDILQRAAHAHFFVFPSRHPGEGHSNALNEAMSVGLVPVCSAQGFTRSVVGNAGVVLPTTALPDDYVLAIEEILSGNRWSSLSERAKTRVRTLYSEESTVPALIDTYRRLLLRR